MKKIISFLLAVGTCLSVSATLMACNEEQEPNDTTPDTTPEIVTSNGVNEEQWNAMLDLANFDNYTLTESQSGVYAGTAMQNDSVFKVAGDKASVDTTVDGTHLGIKIYTGEEAIAQKNSYEQIYRALLADFDHFTYDSEEKIYKTTERVTVDIAMDIYQMSAVIEMENAKVKLSDDGKLLHFECDAKQTTTTPEGTVVATFHANWTFSDYGTTVITETAE